MKAIFSDRAFAAVLAETTEKITTETGGLFLGVVRDDIWYIIESIDPGPKSVFEIAYFEYDQRYTEHLINKIANLYNQKLDLIGLWHRHPGSFDQFSSTDDGTNSKYASMRKEGALSGLVNIDPRFRFTMYHVDQPCRYKVIEYQVGDSLIPAELLQYRSPDSYYSLMQKRSNNRDSHNSYTQYKTTVSLSSFMRFIGPYLVQSDTNISNDESSIQELPVSEKLADAVLDDLTFMTEKVGIEVSLALKDDVLEIYQEAVDKTTKLTFKISEKDDQVVFSYDEEDYPYQKGLFEKCALQAKNDKDKQISEANRDAKPRYQSGLWGSVKKHLFNNDIEGEKNGNKDT